MDERHIHRRVLTFLRPYRLSLVIVMMMGLASTAATLLQPYVIGQVVNRIVGHQSMLHPFGLLVGLFVAEGVLGAAQVYLLGRAGNSAVLAIRRTLVSRLLRAPLAAHLARQRGDTFSTLVADTSLMGSMMTQSLATLTVNFLMVAGSIAFMAYLDLLLTATIVACVLASGTATLLISRRLRQATRQSRDRVGEFGAALQRALGAIKTVKISRAEAREETRIGDLARLSYDTAMRATRLSAFMVSAMSIGVQASFAAVFTVGAFRLADHALSTAMFAAYLLYLLYLIAPLMNLLNGVAQFQQSAASATRVTSLMDGVGTERDGAATPAAPRPAGDVTAPAPLLRFRDVTFGYRPQTPVLHKLSFEIPGRGLTAIVGPSGAGKSTVFSLIERFWDADSGTIELDGTDLSLMPLAGLRARIGYVEQETPVLDGTLRDNLRYACPDADQADLDEVIDLASLRDWVDRLPQGLDTQMGEMGAAVSGGERQRIAIARTLLTKPDLLLLDEATSQLDAEASAALNRTVARISQRCAVLAIAHQLGTATMADRILVLDHGRLRAEGTHDSLLVSDELYARLARQPGAQRGELEPEPVLVTAKASS